MARLALALVLAAALSQAAYADPPNIQNPEFLERPDAADFAQNYPSQAVHQAVEGRATIECYVRLDTTLDCRVTAESPASWGFGDAALAIARSFRVAPTRVDGEPVEGGRIRQTIRFVLPEEHPEDWTPEQRAFVEALNRPDLPTWEEAPTSSMVQMATPEAARRARTQGRGVLSCRVNDERRLACQPSHEMPRNSGFAAAAMTLAPYFRIVEGDADFIARHTNEPFVLPISFGGASEITPVNRGYGGVEPLNVPTIVVPREYIPDRARAAHINGMVVTLCTVQLAAPPDCVIESESPTGWGFRETVLMALELFPPAPPEAGIIPGDQARFTFEFRPD